VEHITFYTAVQTHHTCQRQGQGLEVRGKGQGLAIWSSRILEDKDFPRGQQHCFVRIMLLGYMQRNGICYRTYGWCDVQMMWCACDEEAADEWYYYQSGDFRGFALGSDHEFMACSDVKGDGKPLRKKPFEKSPNEKGCCWIHQVHVKWARLTTETTCETTYKLLNIWSFNCETYDFVMIKGCAKNSIRSTCQRLKSSVPLGCVV